MLESKYKGLYKLTEVTRNIIWIINQVIQKLFQLTTFIYNIKRVLIQIHFHFGKPCIIFGNTRVHFIYDLPKYKKEVL